MHGQQFFDVDVVNKVVAVLLQQQEFSLCCECNHKRQSGISMLMARKITLISSKINLVSKFVFILSLTTY